MIFHARFAQDAKTQRTEERNKTLSQSQTLYFLCVFASLRESQLPASLREPIPGGRGGMVSHARFAQDAKTLRLEAEHAMQASHSPPLRLRVFA
jgi:hypothetical protein